LGISEGVERSELGLEGEMLVTEAEPFSFMPVRVVRGKERTHSFSSII
jgi:hypothetical protein